MPKPIALAPVSPTFERPRRDAERATVYLHRERIAILDRLAAKHGVSRSRYIQAVIDAQARQDSP
jgi:hypothetical protein